MRLTLITSTMNMGGAERQISLLANAWAARGDDVTLFALEPDHPSFFNLHPNVTFLCLGVVIRSTKGFRKARTLIKRPLLLRRSIIASKPDVILSFNNRVNTTTIVASLGLRVPVIVTEVTDPFVWKDTQPWQFLRGYTNRVADALVAQTENSARDLNRKMRSARSVAISTPVPKAEPNGTVRSGTRLVSYARFRTEKRLDRLIEAFHMICERNREWSLVIAGDGPMLSQLKKQVEDLGLSDRVSLPGVLLNPRELLKDADIFVLTSEFEGFPNTLTEAMANGVPVISFNCRSGPSEIIRDGIDGVLVPPGDVPALARAIDEMMNDESMRVLMGKNALSISDRYSVKKILSKWDDVFERVGARCAVSTRAH